MERVTDLASLGASVREARRSQGWTQAQLAERANVSRRFVIALERGDGPRAEPHRVLAVLRALRKDIILRDAPDPLSIADALGKVLE